MSFIFQITNILLIVTLPLLILDITNISIFNIIIEATIIYIWVFSRKRSVKKVVVLYEKIELKKVVKPNWKGTLSSSFLISFLLYYPMGLFGSLLLLSAFSLFAPDFGDFLYRSTFHLLVHEDGSINFIGTFIGLWALTLTIFFARKFLLTKIQILLLSYVSLVITGIVGHYAGYGYQYNNGTILNNFTPVNLTSTRSFYQKESKLQKITYVNDNLEIAEIPMNKQDLKTALPKALNSGVFGPFTFNWFGKSGQDVIKQFGKPEKEEYVEKFLKRGDQKYIYGKYAVIIDGATGMVKEIWHQYDDITDNVSLNDITSILGQPATTEEGKTLNYAVYQKGNVQLVFEIRKQDKIVLTVFLGPVGQPPVQRI